jgi:hypothetical protein
MIQRRINMTPRTKFFVFAFVLIVAATVTGVVMARATGNRPNPDEWQIYVVEVNDLADKTPIKYQTLARRMTLPYYAAIKDTFEPRTWDLQTESNIVRTASYKMMTGSIMSRESDERYVKLYTPVGVIDSMIRTLTRIEQLKNTKIVTAADLKSAQERLESLKFDVNDNLREARQYLADYPGESLPKELQK